MRLTRLTLRGLTRFSRQVTLDFDAVGDGLVALVGPNGAGKTTVLEAVPAVLWKRFPSRPGSLYDYSHGRDAFIEAEFEGNGVTLRVRVQIDADRRTTEGYIFEDGHPLTTGRAAEFDSIISQAFGSEALYLASVFSAQNKAGNFLLMAKAERKGLFVELLGLAHLEELQAGARARRARGENDLSAARAVFEAVEEDLRAIPGIEERLAGLLTATDAAAGRLATAREEEAAAVVALERARGAAERLATLVGASHSALRAESAAAEALEQARGLADKAKDRAMERTQALLARDLSGQEARARGRFDEALAGLKRRRDGLEAVTAEGPAVEAAGGRLPAMREERTALEAAQREAEAASRRLEKVRVERGAAALRVADARQVLDREIERLDRQAGLLDQVPCTKAPAWLSTSGKAPIPGTPPGGGDPEDLAGTCPLLAEARVAKAKAGMVWEIDPAVIETHLDARARFVAADTEVQQAQNQYDPGRLAEVAAEVLRLEALAGRAAEVERAARQLEDLEGEQARARATLFLELGDIDVARSQVEAEITQVGLDLQVELVQAEEAVDRADRRSREAVQQAQQAEVALTKARTEEAALSVPRAEASLFQATSDRRLAEHELRVVDGQRAGLEGQLAALREKRAGLEALGAEVASGAVEVGDWSLLERALGRDGIQALEIDAAGPEVASLTNELLNACYGSRFQVAFETLREKKSKPGEYAEAFDIRVYDNGRERQVEALSGGERVVVGEAIGLALSIFNARKSGVRWETLFRDETAGALDSRNAQAYVDLLRRAMGMGGFRQVIFVSHQQEVWERADVRFEVDGGAVVLDGRAA